MARGRRAVPEVRGFEPHSQESHSMEEAVQCSGGVVAEAGTGAHDPGAEVEAADPRCAREERHSRRLCVGQKGREILRAEEVVDVLWVDDDAVLKDVDDIAVSGLLADHASWVCRIHSRFDGCIHCVRLRADDDDAIVDVPESGKAARQVGAEACVELQLGGDAHQHRHGRGYVSTHGGATCLPQDLVAGLQ